MMDRPCKPKPLPKPPHLKKASHNQPPPVSSIAQKTSMKADIPFIGNTNQLASTAGETCSNEEKDILTYEEFQIPSKTCSMVDELGSIKEGVENDTNYNHGSRRYCTVFSDNESHGDSEEDSTVDDDGLWPSDEFLSDDDDILQPKSRVLVRRKTTIRRRSSDHPKKGKNESRRKSNSTREGKGLQRERWVEMCERLYPKVLQYLDHREIKRQEALFEIVTTEQSYLTTLNQIIEVFVESPKLQPPSGILSQEEYESMFFNISRLRDVDERLLNEMEDSYCDTVFVDGIISVLSKYFQNEELRTEYLRYFSHLINQQSVIDNLRGRSKDYVCLLNLQKHLQFGLPELLKAPPQRISKLPLLIQAVISHSEPGTPIASDVVELHAQIKEFAHQCDEKAGKSEEVKKMVESFEYRRNEMVPMTHGLLIRHGTSSLISCSRKGHRESRVELFVFEDTVVIGREKASKRMSKFEILDWCRRDKVSVHSVENKDVSSTCLFSMEFFQDELVQKASYLFSADSLVDRQTWISAISNISKDEKSIGSPQNTNMPGNETDEMNNAIDGGTSGKLITSLSGKEKIKLKKMVKQVLAQKYGVYPKTDHYKPRGKEVGLFGVPLPYVVQRDKQLEPNTPDVPLFLQRLIHYLDLDGHHDEDVLVNSSSLDLTKLKKMIDDGFYKGRFNITQLSYEEAAGLLRLFLRELPSCLLTPEYNQGFLSVSGIASKEEQLECLNLLVLLLPDENRTTLKYLLSFLLKLTHKEARPTSTATIAHIMAPTLFKIDKVDGLDLHDYVRINNEMVHITSLLILHQRKLWEVPADILSLIDNPSGYLSNCRITGAYENVDYT